MTELEKYKTAFAAVVGVSEAQLPGLVYQAVTGWDSVGHMQLMAELEEVFGIALEMEDILDFSSYEKGLEILRKHQIHV